MSWRLCLRTKSEGSKAVFGNRVVGAATVVYVVGLEPWIPIGAGRVWARPVAARAALAVAFLIGDPPAVERIGPGGVVVWSKGAVAILKRGYAVMPAGAMQSHNAIRALMGPRQAADVALRIQSAAGLRWEKQAGSSRVIVCSTKTAYDDSLHIVMVVCAASIARGERLVDGVPDPGENIGNLGTARGAAGCHHMGNEDRVTTVVGFR